MPSVAISSRRLGRRYGLLAFVLGVAIVGACATGSDDADFGDTEDTTAPTTANVGQGGATAQTNGPSSGETDGAGGNGIGGSTSSVNMQQSAQSSTAMAQSSATGFTSTGTGFTSTGTGLTSTGTGGTSCTMSADCNTGECCLLGVMICFQIIDPQLCLP